MSTSRTWPGGRSRGRRRRRPSSCPHRRCGSWGRARRGRTSTWGKACPWTGGSSEPDADPSEQTRGREELDHSRRLRCARRGGCGRGCATRGLKRGATRRRRPSWEVLCGSDIAPGWWIRDRERANAAQREIGSEGSYGECGLFDQKIEHWLSPSTLSARPSRRWRPSSSPSGSRPRRCRRRREPVRIMGRE